MSTIKKLTFNDTKIIFKNLFIIYVLLTLIISIMLVSIMYELYMENKRLKTNYKKLNKYIRNIAYLDSSNDFC